MTIEAMKLSVNSIVGPHVRSPRDEFSNQSLTVYLVADNHGTHTNPDILALLEWTRAIRIWLRPNSSHFLHLWTWRFLDHSKGITEICEDQTYHHNCRRRTALGMLRAIQTEMILSSFISSCSHVLAIFARASHTMVISVAIEAVGQEKVT
jgi:hypothetical protein